MTDIENYKNQLEEQLSKLGICGDLKHMLLKMILKYCIKKFFIKINTPIYNFVYNFVKKMKNYLDKIPLNETIKNFVNNNVYITFNEFLCLPCMEDYMQRMFLNLLYNYTKNKKYIDNTYYISIIKQLSPLDAINLKYLYNMKDFSDLYVYFAKNDILYLKDNDNSDLETINNNYISIKHLQSLGLINVSRVEYSAFLPTESTGVSNTRYEKCISLFDEVKHFTVFKSDIELNLFGQDFCKICCSSDAE